MPSEKLDHLSKETRMNRKREAFVKNFRWFLLISGLSSILACRSWSQIQISGLGHDIENPFKSGNMLIQTLNQSVLPVSLRARLYRLSASRL